MSQKRHILFAFIILFLAIQCKPVFASPEDNFQKKIDSYVRTAVDAGFSGAVLVARGGKVILQSGYGLADREKNIPVRKETVFDIGSITKRFTRSTSPGCVIETTGRRPMLCIALTSSMSFSSRMGHTTIQSILGSARMCPAMPENNRIPHSLLLE